MAQRLPDQFLYLADGLDAGEAAADDDEGEQAPLAPRVRRRIGLLETAQNLISDLERVDDVLHDQRAFGEPRGPAQIDHLAEGDHQVIIGDDDDLAVAACGDMNGLRRKIDLPHIRHPDGDTRQKQPQRAHRVGGMNAAAGDLGQERLENEEVVAADKFDLDVPAGPPAQMLGGEDPAKSAPDNDHPLCGFARQRPSSPRREQRGLHRRTPPRGNLVSSDASVYQFPLSVAALIAYHSGAIDRTQVPGASYPSSGEIKSMDWLVNDGLPLLARICLVVLFPFSGLDKIVNRESALKQAASSFLPGAPVLLVLAMIVEFVTPVCIVSGWYDGVAAFVLAGYCVITAILYHNFWAYPRFWSPGSAGYPHLWDFLKNFGLVGGLLLIVLGSDLVAQVEHAAKEISASEIVHVQAD